MKMTPETAVKRFKNRSRMLAALREHNNIASFLIHQLSDHVGERFSIDVPEQKLCDWQENPLAAGPILCHAHRGTPCQTVLQRLRIGIENGVRVAAQDVPGAD